MKPVANSVLLILLLALCGLCAWQWQRETLLRGIAMDLQSALVSLQQEKADLDARVQAANAEILRLTGALSELRSNSVDKHEHAALATASETMRETLEKQRAAIHERNESLLKASGSIQQANETIKELTKERDGLAKRLNDLTAKYNEMAKKGSQR